MCMIVTGESNNESMRMTLPSMIHDKKKDLIFFAKKCIKLCCSENRQTCVKGGYSTIKVKIIPKLT